MKKIKSAFQPALFERDSERELTAQETARLERSQKNRRGRKKPAKVPSQLSRTSAFAPKRQGLITDSNFSRTYVVGGAGGSVVRVEGRELGSQHRDALYVLFRLPCIRMESANPNYDSFKGWKPDNPRVFVQYRVDTTWRAILTASEKTIHTNNLLTLLNTFMDIQKVVVAVQKGSLKNVVAAEKKGQLGGAGFSDNIIHQIEWTGVELDSDVTIIYGAWVRDQLEQSRLVSVNAEVQFELKNDHAKSFWPYIDSQPNHTWIDEERLAELAGRDLWGEEETSFTRADFRKKCKAAFEDMVRAKGLARYSVEVTGAGRRKSRRFYYHHALPRQQELELLTE